MNNEPHWPVFQRCEMARVFSPNRNSFQTFVRKAYSNIFLDKTSPKFPYGNQLPESDSIKHIGSAGADNGNRHVLQGGQDEQVAASVAQPLKQHKDVSLGLLRCHYPFRTTYRKDCTI